MAHVWLKSDVHNRTARPLQTCHDSATPRVWPSGAYTMLFIIGALVLLALVLAVLFGARARGGASSAGLGQMSEQWLAENRASHER
jgi:hypothetical protein